MAEKSYNLAGGYVRGRIGALTKDLESSNTKARLANLRRGVGKAPGELPELWGEFLQSMPEALLSKTDKPSYAEWAVYTALTLFALHQQGHGESMNEEGDENRVGRAVSKLAHSEDDRERVRFKLSLAANSDDIEELAYRLRALVKLMSGEDIKLDYADLARDLYLFQLSEDNANKVRLKWGRDFYFVTEANDRKEDQG